MEVCTSNFPDTSQSRQVETVQHKASSVKTSLSPVQPSYKHNPPSLSGPHTLHLASLHALPPDMLGIDFSVAPAYFIRE